MRVGIFINGVELARIVDELDLVEIITKSLGVDSRPMAAGSDSSADIDLNHDHVGFVLVALLDAPSPHLLVAHPSPNPHQGLGSGLPNHSDHSQVLP